MTENEAIRRCDLLINGYSVSCSTNDAFKDENKGYMTFETMREFAETCKQALEEIQQYRAIGTVEGYKRALEISKENFRVSMEYKAKVQAFEAIGTIEEFKALKEKNEPKKIRKTYGTWSGDNYFKFPNNAVVYQCIECYSTVRVGENYYCNCGSCIDWSE